MLASKVVFKSRKLSRVRLASPPKDHASTPIAASLLKRKQPSASWPAVRGEDTAIMPPTSRPRVATAKAVSEQIEESSKGDDMIHVARHLIVGRDTDGHEMAAAEALVDRVLTPPSHDDDDDDDDGDRPEWTMSWALESTPAIMVSAVSFVMTESHHHRVATTITMVEESGQEATMMSEHVTVTALTIKDLDIQQDHDEETSSSSTARIALLARLLLQFSGSHRLKGAHRTDHLQQNLIALCRAFPAQLNARSFFRALTTPDDLQGATIVDATVAHHLLCDGEATHVNHTELGKLYAPQPATGQGTSRLVPSRPSSFARACLLDVSMSSIIHQLTDRNLFKCAALQDIPTVLVLVDMTVTGIRCRPRCWPAAKDLVMDRLSSLEQEACRLAGHPINLASAQQLSSVLFQELRLESVVPPKPTAKTEHVSVDETVLKKLDHPLATIALEHRTLSKFLNTWMVPLMALVSSATGSASNNEVDTQEEEHPVLISCTWEATKTATGRLASKQPNLQNLPVRVPDGVPAIRNAFVPEPGHVLVSFDYNQIELRVLAHFAGGRLASMLRRGEDIHRTMAAQYLGVPLPDVPSTTRNHFKRVVYGILYGMGTQGLATALSISWREAASLRSFFLNSFPEVKTLLHAIIANAKSNGGSVRTLSGRCRTLPALIQRGVSGPARAAAERQCISTVVQGGAADIIKMAMVAVQRYCCNQTDQDDVQLPDGQLHPTTTGSMRGPRIVLQIHDELVLQVPQHQVAIVAKEVSAIMATPTYPISVPMPVCIQAGPSLGQLEPVPPTSTSA